MGADWPPINTRYESSSKDTGAGATSPSVRLVRILFGPGGLAYSLNCANSPRPVIKISMAEPLVGAPAPLTVTAPVVVSTFSTAACPWPLPPNVNIPGSAGTVTAFLYVAVFGGRGLPAASMRVTLTEMVTGVPAGTISRGTIALI